MSVHIARRGFGILAITLALLTVFAAVSAGGRAHAQQVGEPDEDFNIIVFEACSVVSAEVQASDATLTSIFWRFGPDMNLGVAGNATPGTSFLIGEVPAGVELVLGIVVDDSANYTFKTGDGSRNHDGQVHARVAGSTVGFEDLGANQGSDWDYNDAVVSLTTEPCETERVTLTLQVDPASSGTGDVTGGGTFDKGETANPTAVPAAGSTFGGWSGDCGGSAMSIDVVMNSDRTCSGLFVALPVEPTPTPEPLGSTIDLDNTRTSPSPASVGDTVVFRIDVGLTDVPGTNEAEVLVAFDDSNLEYAGALTSECTLFALGIVCDFGTASVDFSFDLDFTALVVTDSTTTHATLGADFDGAGPGVAALAGPASADVAIVDVEGIQLPPLGDGSLAASSSDFGPLNLLLSVVALGAAGGVALGGVSRRRSSER